MPLTLRVKAGQATFAMADGPMKAEWTLTTGMSEEELVDALVGMLRYIKREQPVQRHLHAVQVDEDTVVVEQPRRLPRSLGSSPGPVPPAAMTWTAPVQPKPLDASLDQAQSSGFELIPEDELGD